MSWLPDSQWPIQQMREQDLYFYLESATNYLPGNRIEVENHGVMQHFGSYSYLGLIEHPKINAAAKTAIDQYGTGTHGVRLLAGSLPVHRQLEERIARFKKTESAAVFSSGYLCNFSSITALIGKGDIIFADMLIHASLLDGCLKSGADVIRFRHNDPSHLRKCLKEAPDSGRKLVVIDAVYSMDGDIADLPAISMLAHEHGAWLMVDEAHSIGVLGKTGHGIEEHFGLPSDSIDIKMGTLSKCIPSCGGYIAGSNKLCDFLRHQSRGFIYSGAIPPPVAAAAMAAFDVIEDEPERVQKLQSNIAWFANRLNELGIPYLKSQTAIFPIVCGKDERAFELARFLQRTGYYVQAIPYPVVPPGMARLRVSITSEHSELDMMGFISAVQAGIDSIGGIIESKPILVDKKIAGERNLNLQADSTRLALSGSIADYSHLGSPIFSHRVEQYHLWKLARRSSGLWPFANVMLQAPGPYTRIANCSHIHEGLNFASQDYLSLSSHEVVRKLANEALSEYGPHSASSPALQGNTRLSQQLEQALQDFLHMEHVLLFPTGWAAGFGVVAGLVRENDHVILDQYAHNCTVRGALGATQNIHRVRHNSASEVATKLKGIRIQDAKCGILVVTEGLFSMDADTPDLNALQVICREHDALLMVDVAHDLGALGLEGKGALEILGLVGKVDLVMGSFSKVFASNGGFVASQSRAIIDYLQAFSCSHTFSNAISPVQCATVLASLKIVRSVEGELLRNRLMENATALRHALERQSITCLGAPGPLVPVLIGQEKIGRIATRNCFSSGVFANLVEYPAVTVGMSRFRMQLMASHTTQQCEQAAETIGQSIRLATKLVKENRTSIVE